MNLLLSYYKDSNNIVEWKKRYSSAGQEVILYKFKGTNGRYLSSFDNKFEKLSEVEAVPRSKWPTKNTGQEIHKQYTVPMIETKLFYREHDKFFKTEKGKVYEEYLKLKMNSDEKWLINFLLLMDSTISNRQNYIINRSIDVNNVYEKFYLKEILEKFYNDLFRDKNTFTKGRIKEIAYYDYLYLNSFYLDLDFLRHYSDATEAERRELHDYVYNNWDQGNTRCCISQKYKSTNYSVPELIDDLKIFMFSLQLSKIHYTSFDASIIEIVELYEKDYEINKELILDFIFGNKDIFELILMNVYNVEDNEDELETDDPEDAKFPSIMAGISTDHDMPEKKVDDTTIEGKRELQKIFAMRKKIAKLNSGYKCELEHLEGCKYFTSKVTQKNYVEIHHLIPREFRNNFEYSIDVLSNYISLCPNCHRKIHLATDRERETIIRYIYSQRSKRLEKCGLMLEIKDLLDFYNIGEDSTNVL